MSEPVTLAEAKAHLRVLDADEDDLIGSLIVAAREWVESYTGLTLTARTIVERFAADGDLRLRSWPVRALTKVEYRSRPSGVVVEVGAIDRDLDDGARPGRILLTSSLTGLAMAGRDGVIVTLDAGYESPAAVPVALKQAIKLIIGYLFDNREATASPDQLTAVSMLCAPHRLRML